MEFPEGTSRALGAHVPHPVEQPSTDADPIFMEETPSVHRLTGDGLVRRSGHGHRHGKEAMRTARLSGCVGMMMIDVHDGLAVNTTTGRGARVVRMPLLLGLLTLSLAAPIAAQEAPPTAVPTAARGTAPTAAEDAAPYSVPRLSGPIQLDGVPDEAVWSEVPPLPLTMYFPTYEGTPQQRTEIRVAHDDEYFYAAGWFYDDDPAGIRVNSLYRDRWNGDDALAIYIDAFNDNQNAKWFGTTPSGMRFDLLVSDDGATLNGSWDTFWDSETTITEEGWFVEVRIPFSSLGFQVDDSGSAVMGLTVTRLVSRTNERVTYPAIDPKFAFRQPSVAQDVILQNVRSRKPIYITPYALTGVDRKPVVAQNGSFDTASDVSKEMVIMHLTQVGWGAIMIVWNR